MNNISRRDYFAAMAMQALLQVSLSHRHEDISTAELAIKHADDLLAELDKKNKVPLLKFEDKEKPHEWTECIRGEEGAEFHQKE